VADWTSDPRSNNP